MGQHHRLKCVMTLGHCRNFVSRTATKNVSSTDRHRGVRSMVRRHPVSLAPTLVARHANCNKSPSQDTARYSSAPVPGRSSDAQRPHKDASAGGSFLVPRDTHTHRDANLTANNTATLAHAAEHIKHNQPSLKNNLSGARGPAANTPDKGETRAHLEA